MAVMLVMAAVLFWKDATKVDRSASYLCALYREKHYSLLVWRKSRSQLAYAIGVAQPVSISINTFGTSALPESKLIRSSS